MTGTPPAGRKALRETLLAGRRALGSAERTAAVAAIAARLDALLAPSPPRCLGLWWPIKGELDLRGWAVDFSARHGTALALPAVTVPKAPLVYRPWAPGAAMVRGFWDIFVPADETVVRPDTVLAPLVGFRAEGLWRLGYGGGYFDRTLAAAEPRPRAIGVGLEAMAVAGFEPAAHDVPMNAIVTETRTLT